jgi:hypothetical protein
MAIGDAPPNPPTHHHLQRFYNRTNKIRTRALVTTGGGHCGDGSVNNGNVLTRHSKAWQLTFSQILMHLNPSTFKKGQRGAA